MSSTVTELFKRLSGKPLIVSKHIVHCPHFKQLRNGVYRIMKILGETEIDTTEIEGALRREFYRSLRAPVNIEDAFTDILSDFCPREKLINSWGHELAGLVDTVIAAESALKSQQTTEIRKNIREMIKQLIAEARDFRIYCWNSEKENFESLGLSADPQLETDRFFIHSQAAYRDSENFDILLKAGPMRPETTPDALITAPKYNELIQFAWSGCRDEENFGTDPVHGTGNEKSGYFSSRSASLQNDPIDVGDIVGEANLGIEDIDEIELLRKGRETSDHTVCKFIQTTKTSGSLVPLNSHILAFDPEIPSSPELIKASELSESMYMITWTSLAGMTDEDDEPGDHPDIEIAEEEGYAKLWKKLLRSSLNRNREALVGCLRAEGISVTGIEGALNRWKRSSANVITGPQSMDDFKVLIRCVCTDHGMHNYKKWWPKAWREIRLSRGEAIREGQEEHKLIDEKSVKALFEIRSQLVTHASNGKSFLQKAPEGSGLHGLFHFVKIRWIDDGFNVPTENCHSITNTEVANQWRE